MNKKSKKISKNIYFFYPGNINTKTGGYIYQKNILDYANKKNFKIKAISLSLNYPSPSKENLDELLNIIQRLPSNSLLIFDGLVMEGLLPIINLIKKHTIYTLIHHPLYLEFKGRKSKNFLKKEKKIYKFTDKFLVTSTNTRDLLKNKFRIKKNIIKVIEPGIDKLRKYKKIKNNKIHLLTCGSVIERKNYFYLIQELKLFDTIIVHIVGDISRENQYYNKLKKLINLSKLKNKIIFYGKVSDKKLEKLYSQSDFYISTSEYEGFGMSLANALLSKTPIISYYTETINKTIGNKGIRYFKSFRQGSLSKIIKNTCLNTNNIEKVNSEIKKNKRIFLTPNQSANKFLKEISNA